MKEVTFELRPILTNHDWTMHVVPAIDGAMKNLPEARDTMWNENVQMVQMTFEHGERWINEHCGNREAHSELLVAFVSAATTAYAASVIAAAIQDAFGRKESQ